MDIKSPPLTDWRSKGEPKTIGGNYNMKRVIIEFLFEGKTNQNENANGILFGNKALVLPNENGADFGLYDVVIGENSKKVTVNLDVDSVDYLQENPDLLLELIAA
jgi:hypothetical protein